MKKSLLKVASIVFIIFTIAIFLYLVFKTTYSSDTIQFSVEGKQYHLLVAKNQQEWEKGLMNVKKLDNADGMLFVFPDKKERTFWNMNTLMDLTLYWMSDTDVIGTSFLPSIEKSGGTITVNSPSAVNYVVEIPVKN